MSVYKPPTCGLCENNPVAKCDGPSCNRSICSIHRVATWPRQDGEGAYDYCTVCMTAENAPAPLATQP